MINIKYLGYNILKTDYNKLFLYINKLSKTRNVTKIDIYRDLIYCLFKYNTRFLDYFYFKFFNKEEDRASHTNVWDMHLFHKKFNNYESLLLRDKIKFRNRFKDYFNYPYFKLDDVNKIELLIEWIKKNQLKKLVAKEPLGTVGKGVLILDVDQKNKQILINGIESKIFLQDLYSKGFTLFESFIIQHSTLADITPKSINTIRIVTFVNNDVVEIWGALLRMGYDKSVDNFDAGGLSAKIDLETGRVIKGAKVKDPFNDTIYDNHPITNRPIIGVKIPFWEDIIELIKKAALEIEGVKTVGWDVAITNNGPTLIEGNDNWDKTHFELISEIGLNKRIKGLI